mmetsp:Transcript_24559/g.62346  ORF Transcript_24559/g.62346 Transcript_24559/m.62346 type:complete len:235 (+) Transcript_24559:278-982(+)
MREPRLSREVHPLDAPGLALQRVVWAEEQEATLRGNVEPQAVCPALAAAVAGVKPGHVARPATASAIARIVGVEQHLILAIVRHRHAVVAVHLIAEVADAKHGPLPTEAACEGEHACTSVALHPFKGVSLADAAPVVACVQGLVVEVHPEEVRDPGAELRAQRLLTLVPIHRLPEIPFSALPDLVAHKEQRPPDGGDLVPVEQREIADPVVETRVLVLPHLLQQAALLVGHLVV